MESEFALDLPYKGARDYLHGTDIHDALCRILEGKAGEPLERIDLVFHRMVRKALFTRVFKADGVPEAEPAVVLRFQSLNQNWIAQIDETEQAVTRRQPYDEERVIAASKWDADRRYIEAPSIPGYSNIEMLIPLFKDLLQRVVPDAQGKWLFTRLQLPQSIYRRTFSQLSIEFAGQSGMRLARGAIFGDGEKLGHIFFSLQPAA